MVVDLVPDNICHVNTQFNVDGIFISTYIERLLEGIYITGKKRLVKCVLGHWLAP